MNKNFLSLFLTGVLFTSCMQQTEKTEPVVETTGFETQEATELRDINKQAKGVYFRYPTPDELFMERIKSEFEFSYYLINPVNNIDKYEDSKSQTVNLGIYVADLAYINLFERPIQSAFYYKAVHQLGDQIGLMSAMDKALVDKIEKNIGNSDSLKVILSGSYDKIIEDLIKSGEEEAFSVMCFGAYVEFLFITTSSIKEFDADNALVKYIADQKYAFENLYFNMMEFQSNPLVASVFPQAEKVYDVIEKISEADSSTEVSQADGKIVLDGGNEVQITEQQFNDLKNISEEVRDLLVSGYIK